MAVAWFSTSDYDSVLDFINTVIPESGEGFDGFQVDADVEVWLRKAGFWTSDFKLDAEPGLLVREARSLRDVIRTLIEQRKVGNAVDVGLLNATLTKGSYRIELATDGEGKLIARRRYAMDSAGQGLVPVAIAAAELLAGGDFRLIRKCEGEECALWFYDRTKAHRRRWCNMALCGNREKVARFRTRAKGR
jgi:predicted RNA-binding Zn ribbon-like protein